MPMPIFRPTKVRSAFGIALLVLTIAALLSTWNVSRLLETQRQISDANAVLDRVGDLADALGNSIVASRGTAPDAVQLLDHSVISMQSALREIRQATIDDREQQQRISFLEHSLDEGIAMERRRLDVAKRNGGPLVTLYLMTQVRANFLRGSGKSSPR
jgi:CHASE3 domain sensor protein